MGFAGVSGWSAVVQLVSCDDLVRRLIPDNC